MIMVDHQDKSYVVLDQATMNELVGVMSEAMSQFEEAMKDATPEERAMMEKMMKDRMPGMGGDKEAENYDVYRGEEKISQHCVASWSSIEGGDEMQKVMLEMAEFMDQMAKSFSKSKGMMGQQIQFDNNVFSQLRKLNGFPVQTIDYENGTVESESQLVSSKKTTLNASDLEPPAGYTKRDMGSR